MATKDEARKYSTGSVITTLRLTIEASTDLLAKNLDFDGILIKQKLV